MLKPPARPVSVEDMTGRFAKEGATDDRFRHKWKTGVWNALFAQDHTSRWTKCWSSVDTEETMKQLDRITISRNHQELKRI